MENVSTSQELPSYRKLSKYFFKQTVLFKGLYHIRFIMNISLQKGLTVSPGPLNAVNPGGLEGNAAVTEQTTCRQVVLFGVRISDK